MNSSKPPFSLTYGSVCSGIEAATVAWHPLGWNPAFFSEIEPFPRAVLQYHYPNVPLHGDFTTIEPGQYADVDLLVGGTPCQDFSVAGLRAGLDGDRGNLSLEFLRLADRLRPRWLVWENVPGVFSANEGRAFGAILGALGKLGYGWAYRVLDARYFGVPQRRRRVFVIGCFGNANAAAAVLFERDCLSGNPAPSGATEEDASYCVTSRFGSGRNDPTAETYIASFGWNKSASQTMRVSETSTDALQASSTSNPAVVAYQCHGTNVGPMGTLRAGNGSMTSGIPFIAQSAVRRLTPTECERLQGFPDSYTQVPYRGKDAADGPRYKALGNSMAVPVMRWIGERIAMVEQIIAKEMAA